MGAIKHAVHGVTHALSSALGAIPGGNILADIALAAIPGGAPFIPVLNAAATYGKTGSLGAALGSGVGSYAGNALGSSIFGNLGTVGSTLDSASNALFGDAASGVSNNAGTFLGNAAGNVAGGAAGSAAGGVGGSFLGNALGDLASTPISSALGSYAGNSLGTSIGLQAGGAPPVKGSSDNIGGSSFQATQSPLQQLPPSLTGFNSFTPEQQESNLATQGTYGGGLGPQEQSYFLNLINRQLVDPQNNVSDISTLSPIENSYLSQLGLGGYSNSNNLLQAISQWKP